MKFTLETHQALTIVDPEIVLIKTIDYPITETFVPCVIVKWQGNDIYHELPPQPYVNGTWTDARVVTAIETHFKSISQ
jgi:hypothetical protein